MIGRFVTWCKAWQVATNIMKSSINWCIYRIPDDNNEWRESGNTTLNLDCKKVLLRTAQTSAVEIPFTPDKFHHSQDLDPPSSALRQWDAGVGQKGGEPIARIWEKIPKIENGVNRRRYNHKLDKEFNSPNVLNVTKTIRLRYVGHMIRRPVDQKKLYLEPNPMDGGTKEDRNPGGRMEWTVIAWIRDWTHCAQDR
jgi:hypothetical protein